MTLPFVDVDKAPDEAFGLADDHGPFTSGVHQHDKHQILHAVHGSMTLTAQGKRWLLPSQRGAWIPAGVRHEVASASGIALRTVYYACNRLVLDHDACVFSVSRLAREMLVYAMRWGPSARVAVSDPTREAFFAALALLLGEWIREGTPLYLPVPETPDLARAMALTDAHLEDATVEGAAAAAHVSVRTLSRRFEEQAQMSFRSYLQAARMM